MDQMGYEGPIEANGKQSAGAGGVVNTKGLDMTATAEGVSDDGVLEELPTAIADLRDLKSRLFSFFFEAEDFSEEIIMAHDNLSASQRETDVGTVLAAAGDRFNQITDLLCAVVNSFHESVLRATD